VFLNWALGFRAAGAGRVIWLDIADLAEPPAVRRERVGAGTLEDFQQYVQRSRGEFGCAKPAYVRMRSSWISDRTVCYLASGRPAVIQDTGPSRHLDNCAEERFDARAAAARVLDHALG
jgi:hypothetical protein